MAKRKRLAPASPSYLENSVELETKSALPPLGNASRSHAPISDVAGAAAATAALNEVSETLRVARASGRLVEPISLGAIDTSYLVRDRVSSDEDEMNALKESLKSRGQQSPIEVVDLGEGRYGLISGWRRLTAIQSLFEDTSEPRFATVLAVLRQPESAAEAYQAMVEENELRVGLSFYERARIAAKSVEQGVYPSEKAALLDLFSTASRAKRSKIRSFLPIIAALDGALRFPASIGERVGLQLAKALQANARFGDQLCAALNEKNPKSAKSEQDLIAGILATQKNKESLTTKIETESLLRVSEGISLKTSKSGALTLSGSSVDAALRTRLLEWLQS